MNFNNSQHNDTIVIVSIMTVSIMTNSMMTVSIMTNSMMTVSITAVSMKTSSLITPCLIKLNTTLCLRVISAKHVLRFTLQSVIILSVAYTEHRTSQEFIVLSILLFLVIMRLVGII
jgi:hypothetical protein